ncbi:MAG: hypothetical protein QF790_09265 [Gammaproteobacteria bacterium]|jgi:Mrp family chromosome partitioning ATPase|nr:hypothetical protein [Gammaproteobacteria bacterium]MDP6694941.1 hypothetical protein [Gammaproteobacteria bacterium]
MSHTDDKTSALKAVEQGEPSVEEGLTEKAIKRLMEQKEENRSEADVISVDSRRSRFTELGGDSLTPGEIATHGSFDPIQLNRKRIVYPGSKDQNTLNTFRYMRRRVIEKLDGRKDGVILVTSAVKGGGGTFSAINLATVIAFEKGVSCTIVECNLANAPACKTLEVRPENGWLDFIEDSSLSGGDIIYPTGIKNVSLMPAGGGTGSVSGLVSLGKLTTLFDDLRADSNHFVIIDGPSLDSAGDPRIFSDISDAIVLVVPYARLTPEKLKNSLRGIRNDRIAGVLLNKSPAIFS